VLNGITALNLLGSEQRLLPIRTDLISRNADENEIDEIDESQGVNHTLDTSQRSDGSLFRVKDLLKHSEIFPGVVALHNEVRFPFSGYKKSPKYFRETLLDKVMVPFFRV